MDVISSVQELSDGLKVVLPSKGYCWEVALKKWKLLLEPGSWWGVTPSFLFSWWNGYFLQEHLRLEMEVDYNWSMVDLFHFGNASGSGLLEEVPVSPRPVLEVCGNANYYSKFEELDCEEAMPCFQKSYASVRRSLEGELDRLSVLDQLDKEVDVYNTSRYEFSEGL